MKQCIFMLLMLLPVYSHAQDTITQADGTKVLAVILSISDEYVIYKTPDSISEQTYTMDRDGIARIDYKDGKSIIFERSLIVNTPVMDMERKGYLDAVKNYHPPGGARAGAFLAAMIATPVGGLVPTIITSSVKPSEENLNYPSDSLMRNEVYAKSYKATAKRRKSGKIWVSWGIGSAINLALVSVGAAAYAVSLSLYEY